MSTSALSKYREAKGIIRRLFQTIVLGALLCGSASAADAADDITVMSFNILRDAWAKDGDPSWASRKADVFATIQAKSPDFVGTQEEAGGQMEEIIAALPAYAEVPGRGISSGILYLHGKWDLVDSGKTLFVRYDEGNSKDRYFIWGLFTEKTTNRMIYVYSLHLPGYPAQATQEDRVAGMEQLATHAANRQEQRAPVILTGDFNAKVDTDPMKTLTGEIGSLPIEFIYAYQDAPVTDVSYGIDHILALPGTTVLDSGVAAAMRWDSGSDHPAVFAIVEPWFGDDNHEPVVHAGADQQLVLGDAAWSPAVIASTAWYDASDTSTISASAGAVSVWEDKSGNGNHATQSTGSSQPATGGAINGLNAIDFNPGGTTEHLTTNLEQLTTVSIYLVIDPTAQGADGYSAAIGASASGYGPDSGLFWPLEQWADGTERNKVYYTNSELDKVFCNGVEDSADHNFQPTILSHQGTNLPTANLNYLLGNRSADLQQIFAYKGLMGEVIICPEAHDLATRQKMEGYLAHKWGLAAELPEGHPYKESAPQEADVVSVTLTDATVSDADAGDSLTQSWEVISKPAGAADPRFSSMTAINPTVTFTAAGTYELRLTGSDGTASLSDEVTINIYPQELSQYWMWADGSFAHALIDDRIDADPDGDGLVSLLEFAFGTDPTAASGGVLATDGSAHGQPKLAPEGADMELFFLRRKDHGSSGSVTYRVEFSGDLAAFHPNTAEPGFVANSSSDPDYEVVKVPFPATLPDSQEARFGRIEITPTL